MSEPKITVQAAHVSAGSNLPPRRIVIHATCPDIGWPAASAKGCASGTAKYFAMQTSGGSAHYVEGIDREEHCVKDSQIAWHAPPNARSIGIEITADGGDPSAFRVARHAYTREQWLSPQVWPAVVRAATRAAELCDRFGIPKRRLSVAQVRADAEGICGHIDVSLAFGQTTHSDPGPSFPWDEFMALVVNGQPQEEPDMQLTDKVTVRGADGKDEDIPIAWLFNRMNYAYLQSVQTPALVKAVATLVANDAAQTSLLRALQSRPDVDPAVIQAAVDAAVKKALDDYTLSLTHNPGA